MSSLTVWKFDDPQGADQTLAKLEELSKQELIQIVDAAVVSWPEGAKKPKTRNAGDLTGPGALEGSFWGLLFGIIFLIPIFGLLVGAAAGALAGHFADYGIDDDFIKKVRDEVTPGTSALFLLSQGAVVDRLKEALGAGNAELIQSNLSAEQEAKLREVFMHEDTAAGDAAKA